MELGPILRVLVAHRRLVAAGAVATICIGLALSRGVPVRAGVATTNVILDTRPSDLANAASGGSDTLLWRAELLADLMTRDRSRNRIALTAGVRPEELEVLQPLLDLPAAPTALPTYASRAAALPTKPYVVTLELDSNLPTIGVRADAPDARVAARLADAAATVLARAGTTTASEANDQVTINAAGTTGTLGVVAPTSPTSREQGLAVIRTGPVQAREQVGGRRKRMAKAAGVALVFFLFWIGSVVIVSGVRRAWRDSLAVRPPTLEASP
jgi:hypothetical protein